MNSHRGCSITMADAIIKVNNALKEPDPKYVPEEPDTTYTPLLPMMVGHSGWKGSSPKAPDIAVGTIGTISRPFTESCKYIENDELLITTAGATLGFTVRKVGNTDAHVKVMLTAEKVRNVMDHLGKWLDTQEPTEVHL